MQRLSSYVLRLTDATERRLQCLYALAGGSHTICREHVQAAAAVWNFCDQSAAWLFGGLSGDPDVDRLVRVLKAAPDETLSPSDIYDALGRHKPAQPIAERAALRTALAATNPSIASGDQLSPLSP